MSTTPDTGPGVDRLRARPDWTAALRGALPPWARWQGAWSLRATSIAAPLILLVLWEAVAFFKVVDPRFFPPPSRVLTAFAGLLASGQLLTDLAISMGRIAVGFTIGASLAILVGTSAGVSPVFRALLSPLLVSMYSVPKTALLPLLVLFFGFGEASKIVVLAISAFFLTVVNTIEGVRMINPVLLEVAKNCGVSRLLLLRSVALPGALPYIFTGLKLSWGVALILIVVAEMTASTGGIGHLLMSSWRLFKVQDMVVGLITIGLVGYISNLIFEALEHRLMPWRQ
jgi:NitT/TauT family transport system permease protein